MKIIAGSSFGENIQFVCKCCGCVYELESRNDFNIRYTRVDYLNLKRIPNYNAECPNCGLENPLGYDPSDLQGTDYENTYCFWIPLFKKREDWNERYRVEPIE